MAEFISILRVDPVTSTLFGMIIVVFAKGLFVFLVASIVILAARRLTANQKHIIWFLVIVLFVLIPISWLILPLANLVVPVPAEQSEILRVLSTPFMSRDQYIEQVILSDDLAARYELFSTYGFALHRLPWPLIIVSVWAIGILIFLLRLVIGRIAVMRLISEANECTTRRFRGMLQELTERLNVKQKIDLKTSTLCNIPFVYRIVNPVIILPWKMRDWPDRRIEAVLRHELAHIKRKDCLTQFVARVICALFWFIAPVWFAYRRMQVEQEISCDAYVMISGTRRAEYAEDIIHMVRGSTGAIALPALYNTMAKRKIIKERIMNILSFKPHDFSPRLIRLVLSFVLLLGCLIPILAVSYTTRPFFSGTDQSFYGIWINTDYVRDYYKGIKIGDYKIIQNPSGAWISYFRVDNTTPYCAGDRSVVEKWSDYEGNIWYKTMGTNLAGGLSGYRFGPFTYNELHRVSSSGDVWEYVAKPAHLGWPTEIDPKNPEYRIYYRQK